MTQFDTYTYTRVEELKQLLIQNGYTKISSSKYSLTSTSMNSYYNPGTGMKFGFRTEIFVINSNNVEHIYMNVSGDVLHIDKVLHTDRQDLNLALDHFGI